MLKNLKNIIQPSYREFRYGAAIGIAHLGVGNFFRSHLNFVNHMTLEKEYKRNYNVNWMIHGIGIVNSHVDIKIDTELRKQDFLYPLISLPSGKIDFIGSLSDITQTWKSPHMFLEGLKVLSKDTTKIVSMTITEKGYYQTFDGNLDFQAPEVLHDIHQISCSGANYSKSMYPLKTALGMLVASLQIRKQAGLGCKNPVTILSCDNLPHNGNVLSNLVGEMASAVDPGLPEWITNNVSFPNSMVDRITPIPNLSTKKRISQSIGFECECAIQAEDFLQWVIEEKFIAGRPEWDSVDGVTFVEDVTKHEKMKLRLLNGSHSALAYISALIFSKDPNLTVCRAIMDNDVHKFVCNYMNEVSQTLKGGPGGEERINEYRNSILTRFGNQDISDLVSRLCQDGSKKIMSFLVPTLKEMLSDGKETKMIQKVIASWYVYLRKWKGNIEDPSGENLIILARSNRLEEFLSLSIGYNEAMNKIWVSGVKNEAQFLEKEGPRAFLRRGNKYL